MLMRGTMTTNLSVGVCWCAHLNRNCLFKLDTSIVSMSMTSILPNPVKAKSFSNSQPRPPAPTHSTRQLSCRNSLTAGSGSKSGPVMLPDRFKRKSKSFHRPGTSILPNQLGRRDCDQSVLPGSHHTFVGQATKQTGTVSPSVMSAWAKVQSTSQRHRTRLVACHIAPVSKLSLTRPIT